MHAWVELPCFEKGLSLGKKPASRLSRSGSLSWSQPKRERVREIPDSLVSAESAEVLL